jgi:hypothetical protein
LIDVHGNPLKGNVQIFDLPGKLIQQTNVEADGMFRINLQNKGILMVRYIDFIKQKEFRQKVLLH